MKIKIKIIKRNIKFQIRTSEDTFRNKLLIKLILHHIAQIINSTNRKNIYSKVHAPLINGGDDYWNSLLCLLLVVEKFRVV